MTFIIAEAGVNHNGAIEEALRLVEAAKDCGADAVKFQMFSAKKLGRPEIEHLELSEAEMTNISWHCQSVGIEFMCTPFGEAELAFLKPILKRVKISSGHLTDYHLLTMANATGLPVLLSTGMSTLAEVQRAVDKLLPSTTLLHCTSSYPCPIEDVNLRAMLTMKTQFRLPVGYSDHTEGIVVPIAAVAMGAKVLEKHLTLDRTAAGPDHKASIEPASFKAMVSGIRATECALGNGVKAPRPSEAPVRAIWRRW